VLQALLDSPGAQAVTELRAQTLAALVFLLERAGSLVAAGRYAEDGVAIARATGGHCLGDLLQLRAWVLLRLGQRDAALPVLESGLDVARRLGDLPLTGRLLGSRAYAAFLVGDNAAAARDAAEATQLYRQSGDLTNTGVYLGNLGMYELAAGDLEAARTHMAEALDIARTINIRSSLVFDTQHLGLAEYLSANLAESQALFAESLDLARQAGMKVEVAYALLGLALASRDQAEPGRSARLHGAADQALADVAHTWDPLERRLADQDRQRLQAILGDDAFAAEYAAGTALDPAQVLATPEAHSPHPAAGLGL